MGLAIFLRKSHTKNHFRNIIIGSLKSLEGDNAILCSGFFQENFNSSSYQASKEGNFATILAEHKIGLTTIGIHNNTWYKSYSNFIINLNSPV